MGAKQKKKLVHGERSQAWLDRQDSETRLIMEDLLENSAFEDIVKPSTSEGGNSSNISEDTSAGLGNSTARKGAARRRVRQNFLLSKRAAELEHPLAHSASWVTLLSSSGEEASDEGGEGSAGAGRGVDSPTSQAGGSAASLQGSVAPGIISSTLAQQRFPVGGTGKQPGAKARIAKPVAASAQRKTVQMSSIAKTPGYKADLSMETTEAKRAARSMARGFDLAAVDAYFRHAVETGLERGDLPGVKRLELCQVRALASLYGLEIGGSPSQPAFAATPRTVLPAGRAAAAAEIMLHQFSLRARFGAALLLAEGKATGKEKAGRRDSRESVVNRFAEVYARELGLRAPRWDEELVGERAVAARRLAAELGRGRPGAEEAVQALVERGEVIAVGKKAAKKKKAAGKQLEPQEEQQQQQKKKKKEKKEKNPSLPDRGLAAKPLVRFVSAGTLLDNGPSILQPLKPATWEDGAGEAAQAHPDSGASKARLVLDARLAGGEGLAAELLPVLEDTAGGGGEGSAPLYHSTARGLALRRAAGVAAVTAPMQQLSLGLTKGPGLVTLAGSDEEVSALVALQPMMTKQEAKAARKKAARKEKLALEGRAAAGLPPPPKAPEHGGGVRIEAIPLPPRKDKQKVAKNMGYGQFERHTTGIGSKLLSKWGFAGEGAGLGKDGVGLTEPLLVSQRARQRGLGA
ncbi:hypothetical protein ACKKBF_B03200 [Auxenochlorella protothecoides x Auxenochlorella symbiontica]